MADLNEIRELLDLDEDTLLERLGRADGASFATPEDARERGRDFFGNALDKYRAKICGSKQIREYTEGDDGSLKAQAAAAIADLIGGLGAATVAVLIVQSGVRSLCSGIWR
jgi:hypothetical protein